MVRSSLNLEKELGRLMEVAGPPWEFVITCLDFCPLACRSYPSASARCLYKVIDLLLIDGISGRRLSLIENIPLGLSMIGLWRE